MKTGLILISFIFSVSAFAEVQLDTIKFDGTNMEFAYSTGGGCQEHSPRVDVELNQKSKYSVEATVKIVDVTAAPDLCEAILRVRGSVDLKEMIRAKAEEKQIQGNTFEVVLPNAVISI